MANDIGMPSTIPGRLLLLIGLAAKLLPGALMRKEDDWRRRQRIGLALALGRLSRDVSGPAGDWLFRLAMRVMPAREIVAASIGGKAALAPRDEFHDFGA